MDIKVLIYTMYVITEYMYVYVLYRVEEYVCIYVTRFAKRGLYSFKSHFSSSFNRYKNRLCLYIPLPKVQRSTFTEASFTDLSGVHGCSVDL